MCLCFFCKEEEDEEEEEGGGEGAGACLGLNCIRKPMSWRLMGFGS